MLISYYYATTTNSKIVWTTEQTEQQKYGILGEYNWRAIILANLKLANKI